MDTTRNRSPRIAAAIPSSAALLWASNRGPEITVRVYRHLLSRTISITRNTSGGLDWTDEASEERKVGRRGGGRAAARLRAGAGGAEHNLKNVDVDIPRDALAVFTGVSGSGKSSLAFGTLYAEAQRRNLESVRTSPRVCRHRARFHTLA